MISRQVLSKGQIVIPKAVRELMGIDPGDLVDIDIEGGKIIIKKRDDPLEVFEEVASRQESAISIDDIKKDLEERYGDD